MRARGPAFGFLRWFPGVRRVAGLGRERGLAVLVAAGLGACTLITDVDREKIPQPVPPTFPEVDAGPQPPEPTPDASVGDASAPPGELDAGGGLDGGDAGDASDAAPPGDAG